MRTKPQYGNCLFAILYLVLRGKVDRIIAVDCESKWWPHHYLAVNKDGHILHFMHTKPDDENETAPLWFEGQFIGIRDSAKEEMLKKEGRIVLEVWENIWLTSCIFVAILVILYIPWITAWAFYTTFWATRWTIDALKKRR